MKILETQAQEESSINMTPLIDMVFLLLIFFLVATTFAQEERERGLQLPGSDSPQPLSAPPKYLIINITNEGILKVGGRAYSYREIAQTLTDVAKNQPDRDVLIRADKDSRHEYFARVVELAHKAGISKTKIGYVLRADMVSPGK